MTSPSDHAAYRLRVSPRAKRVQLSVSPFGEIEVVVPRRFDRRRVPALLITHRDWLERKLAQARRRRDRYPHLYDPAPPTLTLTALEQTWRVEHEAGDGDKPQVESWEDRRLLRVRASDMSDRHAAMQNWVSKMARRHLPAWLGALSAEVGLPFNRVTVRAQKTRWGSCSATGNINLNRNLLFLPPALVRYVFIHELCHTAHLDHSARFWALVERLEPDYRRLDKALRGAPDYLPVWVYGR